MVVKIKILSFLFATVLFGFACYYLFINWNKFPVTIASFGVLEYAFFYAYTIYDHIKNLK